MNIYLRSFACAVLLISSLGHHAPAFPHSGAAHDVYAHDAGRAPAWDFIFARADQETDAVRWTAVTRTLFSSELTELELEALERYSEYRLALWLGQRLAVVPTGDLLRQLDAQIGETNKRYLYLTDEGGTRLRDDVGDFLLQGRSSFDIDILNWDSEVADAAAVVLHEFETQVDVFSMALLSGLEAEMVAQLGTRYPELLQSSADRFRRQLASQSAAARRRFVEARTHDTYSLRARSEAQTAAAVADGIILGLDTTISSAFLDSPELLNAGNLVEQARMIGSWEDGFRAEYERGLDLWQEAENALLSERVRWEHESLDNLREAEAAWDNALVELLQRRELWLTEMHHVLQDTQAEYHQRLQAFTQSYELQLSAAVENQAVEHQQLMGEFSSVLDQVHRLDHLRQLSAAQLTEAQHQRSELGNGTSTLAVALDQSIGEWQRVLAEIDNEQALLIEEVVGLERQYLMEDGVPRSAHEELVFMGAELERHAAAVARAEAVLEYAEDLSSDRATAAESYERYLIATDAIETADAELVAATTQLQALRSARPGLVAEFEQAVAQLFEAEQELTAAREAVARREAFLHAQDPELLEIMRLEQLTLAEAALSALDVDFFAELFAVAAEHAAATHFHGELPDYTVAALEEGIVLLEAFAVESALSWEDVVIALEETGFDHEPELIDALREAFESFRALDAPQGLDSFPLQSAWALVLDELHAELLYQSAASEFLLSSEAELQLVYGLDLSISELTEFARVRDEQALEEYYAKEEQLRAELLVPDEIPLDHLLTAARHDYYRSILPSVAALELFSLHPVLMVDYWRENTAVQSEWITGQAAPEHAIGFVDELRDSPAYAELEPLLMVIAHLLSELTGLQDWISHPQHRGSAASFEAALSQALTEELALLPARMAEAHTTGEPYDASSTALNTARLEQLNELEGQVEELLSRLELSLSRSVGHLYAAEEAYLESLYQTENQQELKSELLTPALLELASTELAVAGWRATVEQMRRALSQQGEELADVQVLHAAAAHARAEAQGAFEMARELYEFGVAGYTLKDNAPEAVLAQRREEYERYLAVFTALSEDVAALSAAKPGEPPADLHIGDASMQEALMLYNRSTELMLGMRATLQAADLRRTMLVNELREHAARLVSGNAVWDSVHPPVPFEMLRSVSFATQRDADWFGEYRASSLAEDFGAFSEALATRGDASELLRKFALAYYADTTGIAGAKVALTVENDTAVRRLARIIGFNLSSHLSLVTSAARDEVLGNPGVRGLYEHYRVLVYHGVFVLGSREINNDVSGQVIEDLRASAARNRKRWKKKMKKVSKAHKYFEFKSLRDETRARMRAVAPRSAADARAGLITRLAPVAAARSELGLLPQAAAVQTGQGLGNAEILSIMNPVLTAMPAAGRLTVGERDALLSSLNTEERSSWNTVLQAIQERSVHSMRLQIEAGQAARAVQAGAFATAHEQFRVLLSQPSSDLNMVIEHGMTALRLSPEPLLVGSGELWANLSPAALSASAASLMLLSVEERFIFRTNTEIGLFVQGAAAQIRELSHEFGQREAVLGELVGQGVEHWEQTQTRFLAERDERRRTAERLYYEGLRSFQFESLYLERQRERWHNEAIRLGVEAELTGSAERLGLSTQRLRAEVDTRMPAGITMKLPDLTRLLSGTDAVRGVQVLDLIAAARGLALSNRTGFGYGGLVAPYLPTGGGYVPGSEERTVQRRHAAAQIISRVEEAVTHSSAVESARGIEDARRRALQAVVEGNRRVGDGLAEVLERYGFRSAGASFERRIIADRTVFGGTEYDRQVIHGYRDFRAPDLRLEIPVSGAPGVGAHEFEIAAVRARQQINDFLLLIFGGETDRASAVASAPRGKRDGLLWFHVGGAGENGAPGSGETGRILSALNSAQMKQQIGIEMSKTAVYNQRLFNTGNDYLLAPSLREVGVLWGQTVGALAGAETGAAIGRLAMQAVFTGADLYRGDVSWQDAGKTMGLELGSIALSAATAGTFQHIDHALAIGAQGGAVGFAAGLGLDLSGAIVSQTGSRALASIDIGNQGVSFDHSGFTGSMTSEEAVSGYLAGGVGLGVTHGLGAVNAGEQRLFGFRSDQYEGVAGLNSQAGLLAGEAVRFAREGELHLNLLNLDTFAPGASLGLLELRLGDSSQAGLALGSGGIDTSYNRLATAMVGLDVVNQNRRISAYAREHQQGDGLSEIALRALFAFGDEGEQRQLYRNLLSGEDRLVLEGGGRGLGGDGMSTGAASTGADGTQYRALTRYDELTDGRVVTARLGGDDRYAGLALGVTLGHEAYRDGVVTAHNNTETLWATTAHTEMAGRIAADNRYGSRYLMADRDVLVDLVMLGAGEDSFAQYVAARYDSSDDYWLILEDTDGTISLMDDGRGGVYYQGSAGEEHEIGRYRDGDRLEHLSELLSGLGGSVDTAQLGELIAAQGGSYQDGYFLGKGGVLQLDTRSQDMLGARLDYSRMFVADWRSTGNMDRTVSELAGLIGRSYSYGNSAPSERETNLAFMYGEASEFYRDFLDGRAQDHLFYQHQVEDSTGFARNTLCAATIAINAHQLVDPTISMWQIANAVDRASATDGGRPVLAANGYVADLHAYTRIIAQEFGSDSYLRAMRDFGSASEAWQAGADAVFVKHVNDLVNPTREHHTLTYRYRENDRFRSHGYNQFDPYAAGLSWEQQIAVRYRSMAFADL